MSKFSIKRPRRLASFICLLMGLIIIVSMFTPIFKMEIDVLGNKVTTGVTGYDMIKAIIKKDHLLPESVEIKINDIINKVDKDTILSTSGTVQTDFYKTLTQENTTKLYTYFIYFGAIIAAVSAIFMILFGLLGILIRAKFFKSCNILFALLALVGGALCVAGTVFIAKPIGALITLATVPFSFWAILLTAPALIALVGYMFIRNKK